MVCAPLGAEAATYPAGFEERTVAANLSAPTGMAWAPDGRLFVIEKEGRLKVVPSASGTTATTILDISNEVNSYWDRGLLGIAVDSDFTNHPYVYLLYTRELQPLIADGEGAMSSRLDRFTIGPGNQVSGRTTLLGTHPTACPAPSNTVDCIPSEGASPLDRHRALGARRDAVGREWRRVQLQHRGPARLPHLQHAEPGREDHARGPDGPRLARPSVLPHQRRPQSRLHQDLGRRLPQPLPLQAPSRRRADRRRCRLGDHRGGRFRTDRSSGRRPPLRLALLRGKRTHGRLPGSRGGLQPGIREGGHTAGAPRAGPPVRAQQRGRRGHGRADVRGALPAELSGRRLLRRLRPGLCRESST